MSLLTDGIGSTNPLLGGLGESDGSPYDYTAQGGCVCGGEADVELYQSAPIVSYSLPALRIEPRKKPKPITREYEMSGGCICGGEAEASISLAHEARGGAVCGGESKASFGRVYKARGGCVCGGEAEAAAGIEFTDDEIVQLLMMAAEQAESVF